MHSKGLSRNSLTGAFSSLLAQQPQQQTHQKLLSVAVLAGGGRLEAWQRLRSSVRGSEPGSVLLWPLISHLDAKVDC